MRRKTKTLFSMILAVMLFLSLMPLSAMAASGTWASGTDAPTTTAATATDFLPEPTPITTPEPTPIPSPEAELTPEPELTSEPTQIPANIFTPEPTPEFPTASPTEYATPTTAELTDVQPELIKVVSEPLVKVEYHYYDEAQSQGVMGFSDYAVVSSHSFYAIAMARGESISIAANKYPGIVPVSTDASRFRVLLNDSEDITSVAAYDAGTGEVFLPPDYMGHRITVEWYCPASEVVDLPVKMTTSIFRGAFVEATEILTLPSNANTVSIPFVAANGLVVSQNGIDLDPGRYSVSGDALNITASALGGDLEVSAYAPQRMTRASTSVSHTRSADQIYYGYYTSYYTANGNAALCLDPNNSGLPAGNYPISRFLSPGSDSLLIKCAYYLYGGPGYPQIHHRFEAPNSMSAYGVCHAAASYIYINNASAFQGLSSTMIELLVALLNYVNSLPAPPSNFRAFLYNAGSSVTQPLLSWEYDNSTPPSNPPTTPPTPPPPPPPGNLEIIKVSANTAMTDGNSAYSLGGAAFDAYDSYGQRGGGVITDASGRAGFQGIPAGSGYYFTEVAAPNGYALNATRIPFSIASGQTTTIQVPNVPQSNPITALLRKRDSERNANKPQGGGTLAGAQFTIRYYKGLYTAANVQSAAPARTWVVRTDADGIAMLHPNYLVSGDAFYYNSSGVIVLPLGTVTIQETQAPAGYLSNGELFVRQITASGNSEAVYTFSEPAVPEAPIRGGVSIEKWDFELNRKAAPQGNASLAGTVLEIYNRNANSVLVGGREYAPNAVVHTLTTDATGTASTASNLLPYGTYELIEKSPPTGYLNTGVIRQTFNISQNGVTVNLKTDTNAIKNNVVRGGIETEKWDIELDRRAVPQGNASLAGVVLEIYNRSAGPVVVGGREYAPGAVVHTLTTNATGAASTANNLLPYGSYELVEKSPPTGYLQTGVLRQAFDVTASGEIVSLKTASTVMKNDVIRGGIAIEKWDFDLDRKAVPQGDATLEGSVFEVYNRSAGPVVVGGVEYAPGSLVHTMTTDDMGAAATANDLLPYGKYEVIEKSPPAGYLHTGVLRQTFDVTTNGVIVSLKTSETVIKNNVIRGGVEIFKWDIERNGQGFVQGDATLEGAVFEIWNRSPRPVVVAGVEYAPNQVVHTMTTDADGWAGTENDFLPYGSYEIVERAAPEGYLNTGVIRQSFQIREQGTTVAPTADSRSIQALRASVNNGIVSLTTSDTVIKNNVIRGGVRIEKWDNEISGLLDGDTADDTGDNSEAVSNSIVTAHTTCQSEIKNKNTGYVGK